MAFVQFTRVSLAFADRDILKEVGLNLASGSRAALAGANGSGKSTLMKVIAGKLAADSGERAVQKGCRISYLPQSGIVHRGSTLREEAETAYAEITALMDEMETIGRALESATTDDSRTAALLDEHHRLHELVENSGYYHRDQSIAMVLSGLGFSLDDLDRPTEEFSGGWQMRIALAKVLLEAPDILLLDEPTNYLDIEARSWLEQWLRSFTGGYLLVSHDRYFLDVTVNEVYELFQGQLKRYAGNYTAYEQVRQTELDSLLKRYAAQQEEIAKAEDLIRRFRYKATKAAMVQERIKKLEKMERIEIPESLKKISISFPKPPHSGRIAMTLEGIGKNYGTRPVIGGLDLILEAGEKLVVVGRNGAGKTTLLRILAGADQNFTGKISYGAGIQPGYFSQDAAETMTGSQQVLEYLEKEAPTELIPRVRDMLGAFLFRGDDVYKSISVLSGGEKSRLALLRMLLKPMNLLILDEPTNHLDLQSKDILLDTLKGYNGTIIFVSHDRAFMEALSTKTLELSARGPEQAAAARLFYGDYGYYLDRIVRETAGGLAGNDTTADDDKPKKSAPDEAALPAAESPAETVPAPLPRTVLIKAGSAEAPLGAAAHRELSKQRQSLTRRLEREEEEILKVLEALEAEKTALETELAQPAVYSSGEKARTVKARLDGVTAELEGKNREWEAKAAELERAAAE
ncbi:ABC-F family ATP-binding cassette domain-containing protein [Treponema primitia]|uniref:ABC-F family ATP-binding cassette domain-containing protein n=1 Tax=Treponema primitia TaxID=88058 RepID=UPI000255567F|nr:ABC-F family ATP-binding cassette domain-containing protein [Treponema primitia]